MDSEIIENFAKIRADLSVHNMILTQLLGSYIQSKDSPVVELGQMHEA